MKPGALLAALAALLLAATVAQAQTLTLTDRDGSRTLGGKDLLTHPAAQTITIADPVYRQSMRYRAVPTAVLLKALKVGIDDYVQAQAIDKFSVAIPARLLIAVPPADVEAYVAVEDPASRWPPLPVKAGGKSDGTSAGPFYVVWQQKVRGQVSSEYWAYKLASLTVTDSPMKRWPGLAVDESLPAADPIRRGLDRFVAVCMACHRFNGEGEGEQGPDLARPMNPVEYFQPAALKKYIRNPASVRAWGEQKMPGFDPESLPDADIDAILAWLGHKAARK